MSALIWCVLSVVGGVGSWAPAWGPKAVPDGPDHWLVRWSGDAVATVDGRPSGAPGRVRIPADGAHSVAVEGVVLESRARPRDPCAPLRFVALGDGRAAVNGVGPSAYWEGMLEEVARVEPAFILNTGDLVKEGESKVEWDRYLAQLPLWPPMLAVRGNHDKGGLFESLGVGVGPVFGWTAGPVLIAGIDTEVSEAHFARLVDRLDKLLAASDAPWKIVFMHRPVYSRGPHGSDERGFNQLLVPVFERNGVQLVLSGHDHDYERFCPTKGLGADRRCVEGGVTYVVTGGAATFTMPFPDLSRKDDDETRAANQAASQVFSGSRHFIELVAWRGSLEVKTHRTRVGNVDRPGLLDHFLLTTDDPTICQHRYDGGVR